jgi:simple sugar transport system permease protein
MVKFKLEKHPAPYWLRLLLPFIAIVATFILTSIILLISKVDPLQAFYYILVDPLSSRSSLIEILVKTTPLFLTGIAVTVAFASGFFNIGAEGQMMAGAAAGAGLGMVIHNVSPVLGIPAMILGGFIAGAAWVLIPALLKVKLSVDEVVTTLLMNSVVGYVISFLLNGPWKSPISGWPQSPEIDKATVFFKLIPRTRLHFGFIIALVMVFLIWLLLKKTRLGFNMRASGMAKDAAFFTGIDVNKTMLISALISGGIAGIAGAVEVGGIHYHLIEALSGGLGYSGIIVATLSSLNPLGVVPSALFIGLIDTGSQTLSRAMGVPVHLGDIVQALLLLVILGTFLFQNYRIRRVK